MKRSEADEFDTKIKCSVSNFRVTPIEYICGIEHKKHLTHNGSGGKLAHINFLRAIVEGEI
jgi:hypothetical protein